MLAVGMEETPPPRCSQPCMRGNSRENFPPSSTSAVLVATPTKTAAVSLGQKHPWGVEVKNGFIHYGSPARTISVATPPKTVPCNFKPELQFPCLEEIRTPRKAGVISALVTPSTAGGYARGASLNAVAPSLGFANSMVSPSRMLTTGGGVAVSSAGKVFNPPSAAPLQLPNQPTTLLRLSDFLPPTPSNGSNSASAASNIVGQPTSAAANATASSTAQPLSSSKPANVVAPAAYICEPAISSLSAATWQNYEAVQMPSIPPLPGPMCGGSTPHGYSVAAAYPNFEAVPPMHYQHEAAGLSASQSGGVVYDVASMQQGISYLGGGASECNQAFTYMMDPAGQVPMQADHMQPFSPFGVGDPASFCMDVNAATHVAVSSSVSPLPDPNSLSLAMHGAPSVGPPPQQTIVLVSQQPLRPQPPLQPNQQFQAASLQPIHQPPPILPPPVIPQQQHQQAPTFTPLKDSPPAMEGQPPWPLRLESFMP